MNIKKITECVNLHYGAFTKSHSRKINPHFMFLVRFDSLRPIKNLCYLGTWLPRLNHAKQG